ncbi:protein XRI1-like [Canna indica]|uniref:Protein XRI1-like n=1 Tax=Canna indica TaxID=4628 RepID=A0AAQ3L4B7_9LILI|nr:protein XRI1-like [Canna indica]
MMALDLHNSFLFPGQSPMDWDPHSTFGLGDLHEQFMPLEMENSPASSQASTGYLQDAVAEWSNLCKRRRLASSLAHDSMMTTTTTMGDELEDLFQVEFWDSNCYGDPLHGLNYMLQGEFSIPDDPLNILLKTKTQAAAALQPNQQQLSSSSSYEELQQYSSQVHEMDMIHKLRDAGKPSLSIPKVKALTLKECDRRQFKKNKTKTMTVVYPFAVVKPGGFDGDVTLDDINARLLRRPRRPVRHPVGEFANGPRVAAEGPGLSGKAVVSLTRIQTQGRGTITIIRTRG